MNGFDFQEPYLRATFGLFSVTDIEFITAQPMDITPEIREQALGVAIDHAKALASRPDWASVTADRQEVNPLGLKPQPIAAEHEDASPSFPMNSANRARSRASRRRGDALRCQRRFRGT